MSSRLMNQRPRGVLRRLLLASSLLAALAALAGCGSSGTQSGSQLVVGAVDTRTPTFGPWSQSTHSDALVESLLFSNLVKVAPNEKTIKPDLATSWSASPDARVFTFHLRRGVKWSDGRPFTAKDVVFTVTQAAHFGTTPYIGFQPEKWLEVKGADKAKGTDGPVPGVRALDDHTVRMTLSEPDAQFVRNLTSAVYSIVPAHLLGTATAKDIRQSTFATTKPVGTGPYRLKKYVRNQYLQFEANPSYFGGAVPIRTVFYKPDLTDSEAVTQLESGDLQLAFKLAPEDASRLAKTPAIKPKFVTSPGAEFLQFRVDNPQVSDARIRQAFYYAIDRRAMLQKLFHGHGKVLWNLPGFDPSDPGLDRYPYDPAKAKQLLRAAHYDFGQPLKLFYAPDIDPLWERMAAVTQHYLKAVGVNVVLDPVDSAKWEAAMTDPKPEYALTLQAGGSMGLGPDRSSVYFNCKSPVDTFFKDCRVTRLYRAALATTDAGKQAATYRQIGRILNKQLPFAALWQTDLLHAYSTKIGGNFTIYPDWQDTFFGITGWKVGSSA